MTTLDKVRAKIIEAVPEIVVMKRKKYAVTEGEFNSDDPSYAYKLVKTYRPITLADVLRAMPVTNDLRYSVDSRGYIWEEHTTGARMHGVRHVATWNLALSYDDQTDEVKEFIGKVLGV